MVHDATCIHIHTYIHTNVNICSIFNIHAICAYIVNLMAAQWKPDNGITEWLVEKSCKPYEEKFDNVFEQIKKLSYTDDLLAGVYIQYQTFITYKSLFQLCRLFTAYIT